jgi:hypothetical protein
VSAAASTLPTSEVARLTRRERRLTQFTVTYNVVEGIIAITAGLAAGLVSLVGFGLLPWGRLSSGGGASRSRMRGVDDRTDRVEQARERARLVSLRAGEIAQQLAALGDGLGSPISVQARGAARATRQAAALSRRGYELAADAHERAARAHERLAEGLEMLAKRPRDDREWLLHRAAEHRRIAVEDRNEAAVDRATAEGLA